MYSPATPPSFADANEAGQWFYGELQRVAQAMVETTVIDLRPIFAEPIRPRDGMIVFADGVEWDPGSGRGLYVRDTGAWVAL